MLWAPEHVRQIIIERREIFIQKIIRNATMIFPKL